MARPQHLPHIHQQPYPHQRSSLSPPVSSPTFVRNHQRPISPVSSIQGDYDREALEQLLAADAAGLTPNLQSYPIRARRPGYDPLESGITFIARDLDETLLPLLHVPMPKGPDNIGAPNCRSVKGVGGSMVSVAPVQNVYAAIRSTQIRQRQAQHEQDQQQQQQQHQQHQSQPLPQPTSHPQQQLQRQNVPHPYQTPSFTPSPPSSQSPIEPAKPPPPRSNSGSTDAATAPEISQPQGATLMATKTSPKQPKKEPQEEFKTEFRFVVNEDAKTARNTVRQHVMREFRRRERWEQGKDKVSKAKKPSSTPASKKDGKGAAKSRKDLSSTARQQQQQNSEQSQASSSFDSSTMKMEDVSVSGQSQRRGSQTMSVSASSDSGSASSSLSEGDKFAAILHARTLSHRRVDPATQPFAQYVDKGIRLKPEDVEEAVEEIERSELAFMPYKNDPWAEIARCEINPFASQVSLGAGPASRALLHHYAWVMPSLMDEIVTGNVFHRIGWLYSAVAVHDPTPYHTIMGFTLGHVAMLRGMEEPPLATEHKEKSIQLIHSRLANPLVAASDGSIGAIANIAAYELIDCRPERFAIHMQGLSRLVTERGGMSDFARNPELETVLIRLDAIRAYVTISAPRFPAWSAVRKLTPLAINIGPSSTNWFCPPADHHQHSFLFSEDAIRLIHNVEDIMLLMRSIHPTIPFTPDPSYKSLLMDSILTHLRRDGLEDGDGGNGIGRSDTPPSTFAENVSRRVIRLAALVLFDIAASEFFNPPGTTDEAAAGFRPPSSSQQVAPLPGTQSSQSGPERKAGSPQAPKDRKGLGQAQLRERFPAVEQNRHQWGRSVEMILAVLMQAERMALERPFRAWYVADVVTITMKMNEGDWMAVEEAIQADLVKRVMEERERKEERRRNGIEEDGIWDLEEVVTLFWQEWYNGSRGM